MDIDQRKKLPQESGDPLNMSKLKQGLTILGFLLLSIMVLILLGFTAVEAWKNDVLGGIISGLILFGAVLAIFYESKNIFNPQTTVDPLPQTALEIMAVVLGGLLAYLLAQDLELGAVIAASLVAIAVHLVAPKLGAAAYCGAFVGMTSNLLFLTPGEVLLASLVSGIIFYLTKPVFSGSGGKLGTIALIGSTLTCFGLQRIFLATAMPDWRTAFLIVLVALVATPLTFYLSINRGHGPVLASAVVGLVGGLLLPNLFPEIGWTLAVVAICASFAGMTGKERCSNFWQIALVGFFTGVVFIYSTPLLGGAGGKLGTIAFGAVISNCGYTKLIHTIKNNRNANNPDRKNQG